jgi:hypothetical protein
VIVQPEPGAAPADTAAEALWALLARRLEIAGAPEVVEHLRDLAQVRVESEEDEGSLVRVRLSLHKRISDYTARYNARTAEQMSWFFDALMEGSQPGQTVAACLDAATAVARPPAGADLELSEMEEQGDATVFVARWRHVRDGIEVEGDYIQVLVNPRTGKAFGFHTKWHDVREEATER